MTNLLSFTFSRDFRDGSSTVSRSVVTVRDGSATTARIVVAVTNLLSFAFSRDFS